MISRTGRFRRCWLGGLVLILGIIEGAGGGEPIRLHPGNPHYFLWRGRSAVLVGSGEHYGAVLNRDFDYLCYLDTLAADGLNLTRTFSGVYVEKFGFPKIAGNTLAPKPGRLICPWARSDTPGYAGGGDKFDLARWDPAYFARLKDFVSQAARRGVVVEFTLFCPMYKDRQWALSPMNSANHVNGVGAVSRADVYTLDRNGGLLPIQEALVRKVVGELRGADNVIYEICNEPYAGGIPLAWQHRIAETIEAAERNLGVRHLVSRNVANGHARIRRPHPAISVFNFHYASPPVAVAENYALNRVIGDNETGFRGTANLPYRLEAWNFIMAGGGLFNHLDYSFTVGHEDGTFNYPPTQPGGGNATLRRQFRAMMKFVDGFDFVRMHPDASLVTGGVPKGYTVRGLADPGHAWALYLSRDASLKPGKHTPPARARRTTLHLAVPPGRYHATWWDPVRAAPGKTETLEASASGLTLASPEFRDDVALAVRRMAGKQ